MMTTKTEIEKRVFGFATQAGEEEFVIEGYAATFEDKTVLFERDKVKYYEVIQRNSIDKESLIDVILNWNHNWDVLARTRNNTLSLSVDDKGLFFRAFLGDTPEGRACHDKVKKGYYDKMSFAFTVAEDEYDRKTNTRIIKKIDKVYDVSLVSHPAYSTTSVSARSKSKIEQQFEADLLRQKIVCKLKSEV